MYIPSTDVGSIICNGESVESLSLAVLSINIQSTGSGSESTECAGTFVYSGSESVKVGENLCIYSGTEQPDPEKMAITGDDISIAYVTVTAVNGTAISYHTANIEDVLFVADTLPVCTTGNSSYVAAGSNSGGSITIPQSELDFTNYKFLGLDFNTTLDEGDYLILFDDANHLISNADESHISYGLVKTIAVIGDGVQVTFTSVTAEQMQEADCYKSASSPINGEYLLKDTDVQQVQSSIQQQVAESGFVNSVMPYVFSVVKNTESFTEAVDGDNYTVEYYGNDY